MTKAQKVFAVAMLTGCDTATARETLIADDWQVDAAVCDILAFEPA